MGASDVVEQVRTVAGLVLIEGEDRRTHRVPLSVIARANLEVEF